MSKVNTPAGWIYGTPPELDDVVKPVTMSESEPIYHNTFVQAMTERDAQWQSKIDALKFQAHRAEAYRDAYKAQTEALARELENIKRTNKILFEQRDARDIAIAEAREEVNALRSAAIVEPLTDDEIAVIVDLANYKGLGYEGYTIYIARAVERVHGIGGTTAADGEVTR